ncbi:FAD-binding oxidoreductase [Patulibacter minatonensis]|uniref:FAD-binding oxidoreductase n=1 Tax=Patulibacter minatonensis TaxID=298163 RepID=UPI0004B3BFE2|nr:FAD-linked oxidase C-terminal domain-containing protein [Patulibacter minatonensis]
MASEDTTPGPALPGQRSPSATLLAGLAGAGDVVADPDVLEAYRRDQAAPGLLAAGMPAALVRPTTTAEVQVAVRAAAAHGVPVVPRGAGSGLSGGANAIDGCVVVSLERMDRIVELDAAGLTATVQPGVVNAVLGTAAAAEGLWYAPDPASREFSTIGGNIATNAGGLCCVKYGVTRDALLSCEVVLADGRAVRVGHRTRKGVAGYDLAGLICGSEGTLGIVTEATVRLLPAPPRSSTLAATFSSLVDAGEAVAAIVRRVRPSMLELLDRTTLQAVQELEPLGYEDDVHAVLFARSDAGADAGLREIELIQELCDAAGATLSVVSDDEAEGRAITVARQLAYPALERKGTTLLDDVAVPLPQVPALLAGVERIAVDRDVLIGTFGHAGDGNMHPTVVYDHRDADAVLRARAAFDAIVALALELGGTVSGEHGVGLLKTAHLDAELGDARGLGRAIKDAWDPAGTMNPGKAI